MTICLARSASRALLALESSGYATCKSGSVLRALLASLLVALPMSWLSCTATAPTNTPVKAGALVPLPARLGAWSASNQGPQTIVLVALDGVRWQDVFHGVNAELAREHGMQDSEILSAQELVPNLTVLGTEGAALSGGAEPGISASGPHFISIPGYVEMLTGRRYSGCANNRCRDAGGPTLADHFAALPGTSPLDVAVISSWESIAKVAAYSRRDVVVSAGRRSGATRDRLRFDRVSRALLRAGERAGPYPGVNDYRRDDETSALVLHYLRVQRPRFLFVGLGDTDEYGHKNDYRGYLRALTHADHVIGRIAAILAGYEAEGRRATLFVTTDHGRGDEFTDHGAEYPESAAVWLIAAGWGIEPRGSVVPDEPVHLADIAATIRRIGGIPDREPSSDPIAEIVDDDAPRLAFGE